MFILKANLFRDEDDSFVCLNYIVQSTLTNINGRDKTNISLKKEHTIECHSMKSTDI